MESREGEPRELAPAKSNLVLPDKEENDVATVMHLHEGCEECNNFRRGFEESNGPDDVAEIRNGLMKHLTQSGKPATACQLGGDIPLQTMFRLGNKRDIVGRGGHSTVYKPGRDAGILYKLDTEYPEEGFGPFKDDLKNFLAVMAAAKTAVDCHSPLMHTLFPTMLMGTRREGGRVDVTPFKEGYVLTEGQMILYAIGMEPCNRLTLYNVLRIMNRMMMPRASIEKLTEKQRLHTVKLFAAIHKAVRDLLERLHTLGFVHLDPKNDNVGIRYRGNLENDLREYVENMEDPDDLVARWDFVFLDYGFLQVKSKAPVVFVENLFAYAERGDVCAYLPTMFEGAFKKKPQQLEKQLLRDGITDDKLKTIAQMRVCQKDTGEECDVWIGDFILSLAMRGWVLDRPDPEDLYRDILEWFKKEKLDENPHLWPEAVMSYINEHVQKVEQVLLTTPSCVDLSAEVSAELSLLLNKAKTWYEGIDKKVTEKYQNLKKKYSQEHTCKKRRRV